MTQNSIAMAQYRSWIPTKFEWAVSPTKFGCRIPTNCEDLVATLAAGTISVIPRNREFANGVAGLKRGCVEGACYRWLVQCDGPWEDVPKQFYVSGVFQLSPTELFVLIGDSGSQVLVSPEFIALKQEAADRMERHRKELEVHREQMEEKRADLEHDTTLPDEVKRVTTQMMDAFGYRPLPPPVPPRLSDLSFRPEYVTLVAPLPLTAKKRHDVALESVIASGRGPSRNGIYDCTIVPMVDGSEVAYMRWTPRQASTPALEIKSALERNFKGALLKPRRQRHAPPKPELISGSEDIARGALPDADEFSDEGELSDFFPQPTGEGREAFKADGFEAFAWYQSFHCYDEASWGIHFHSRNLDRLVADLAHDLSRIQARSRQLAALLGVRLLMAHELFHARTEFAATWHELSEKRRRYRRYFDDVYTRNRFTADWLEEALANWSAHEWLLENIDRLHHDGIVRDPSRVRAVVEEWLDFSPAGYRDWRAGDNHITWDRLASEIAKGEPGGHGAPAPIGGLLRSNTLFDLRLDDIPVYFVGQGVIASMFFGAPSRREVTKILRHFGYGVLSGRGKGSHEVWKGPAGKTFTVPARDPLSTGVFHSLLEHFGWSKQQYMQQIRAQV